VTVVSTQFKVIVELNQQQEQLVERLLKEGGYGITPGEVIHNVFLHYCAAHPELMKAPASKPRRSARRG
jgi:hypothetical protein